MRAVVPIALLSLLGCLDVRRSLSPSEIKGAVGAVADASTDASSRDVVVDRSPGAVQRTTTDSWTSVIMAIGYVAGAVTSAGAAAYLLYIALRAVRRGREVERRREK